MAVDPAARFFGDLIKWFREKQKIGRSDLGKALGYERSTIIAFESGRRALPAASLERLDILLEADGALIAAAERLGIDSMSVDFAEYADVEPDAVSLMSFETMTFPGLLQTEEYARAVIGARWPPLDQDTIDRKVDWRMERQVLLTRRPMCVLEFVLEEWILKRTIGGQAVLKGQLHRILEAGELPNVSIQVLPFECDEHPGLDGPMITVMTGSGKQVAYAEGQGGGAPIEDPDQVRTLNLRCARIRAQALPMRDSRALIEQIAGEL